MRTGKNPDAGLIIRYLLPFLIIAFGAFLRFEAIQDTEVIGPLRSDAGQYAAYAMNLLHHHTYSRDRFQPDAAPRPDSVRPPVYPLFLAAVLSFSPKLPVVLIQYLQAALSTVVILFALMLVTRFLPMIWANFTAFLVAVSPHLIISNVYVLTESLFTFGLIGCLLFCARSYERNGNLSGFGTGAAFGALTLTRSATQYFILPLAAVLRWQGKPLRYVLLVVLGFVVVFGAWSTRNAVSTGELSSEHLMINFLHHGMYPDFKYQDQAHTYGFAYRYDPDSSSVSESTASILHEILNRFRDEPQRHLRWFILGKPVAFWQWDMIQGMGDVYVYPVESSPYFSRPVFQWTHSLSKLLHTPLVILGFLGSVGCWFVAPRVGTQSAAFCVKLVAALIIYYQLIHMIGAPFPRYSVPLRPLIYAMAAYFLYASTVLVCGKLSREKRPPTE